MQFDKIRSRLACYWQSTHNHYILALVNQIILLEPSFDAREGFYPRRPVTPIERDRPEVQIPLLVEVTPA